MIRIAAAWRRTFGLVREHVGTDHFGNKYFIIPEQKTWTGRVLRAKRVVEAAKPSEHEYLEGDIPTEWDAWIRGRRKEAPSLEELTRNQVNREQVRLRVRDLEQKEERLQIRDEGPAPSRTLSTGHASAAQFGKEVVSEEPTSTANTFQPGAWIPKK